MSEKRRKSRFTADNIFAAISVVGGSDQGLGLITNVSEGGVCVRTPIPPPRYGKVVLRISMDNHQHEVHAMVRRVDPCEDGAMYDVGMQFAPNDPGKQRFLDGFLTRLKS